MGVGLGSPEEQPRLGTVIPGDMAWSWGRGAIWEASCSLWQEASGDSWLSFPMAGSSFLSQPHHQTPSPSMPTKAGAISDQGPAFSTALSYPHLSMITTNLVSSLSPCRTHPRLRRFWPRGGGDSPRPEPLAVHHEGGGENAQV